MVFQCNFADHPEPMSGNYSFRPPSVSGFTEKGLRPRRPDCFRWARGAVKNGPIGRQPHELSIASLQFGGGGASKPSPRNQANPTLAFLTIRTRGRFWARCSRVERPHHWGTTISLPGPSAAELGSLLGVHDQYRDGSAHQQSEGRLQLGNLQRSRPDRSAAPWGTSFPCSELFVASTRRLFQRRVWNGCGTANDRSFLQHNPNCHRPTAGTGAAAYGVRARQNCMPAGFGCGLQHPAREFSPQRAAGSPP